MEREEELETTATCSKCGATIEGGTDRAYGYGEDRFLCFRCAESAGGRFDAESERWTRPPDVRGLGEV